MVGKGRSGFLLGGRQRHPTLQTVDRLAVGSVVGRRALGMDDATTCGHPVDLARTDRRGGAEAVAMHDLPVEQEGDGGEADMGMRPHVDALTGAKLGRPEMIEEDEGPDHAPLGVRERAAHREMADVYAARHHDEVDGVSGFRIAGRRILGRKEAHGRSLRADPRLRSLQETTVSCHYHEGGPTRWGNRVLPTSALARRVPIKPWRDQGTSSGSVPVGLPEASRVIFSTRASAWRNTSSQRRLSASPRS